MNKERTNKKKIAVIIAIAAVIIIAAVIAVPRLTAKPDPLTVQPPTELTLTAVGLYGITAEWAASAEAEGYEVSIAEVIIESADEESAENAAKTENDGDTETTDTDELSAIETVTDTTYEFGGLTPDTLYEVTVAATATDGEETVTSEAVTAELRTGQPEVPAVEGLVGAADGTAAIDIAWHEAALPEGEGWTLRYEVYAADDESGTNDALLGEAEGNTYKHEGLAPQVTKWYTVRAIYLFGDKIFEGERSAAISVITDAETVVETPAASNNGGSSAPAGGGGGGGAVSTPAAPAENSGGILSNPAAPTDKRVYVDTVPKPYNGETAGEFSARTKFFNAAAVNAAYGDHWVFYGAWVCSICAEVISLDPNYTPTNEHHLEKHPEYLQTEITYVGWWERYSATWQE
jgi:hypothetical protein